MISIVNGALITRHLVASEFLGLNAVHSQLVRWKRKPLWLGTAKTKIFRVPKREVLPKEEVAEVMRLHNNYRTYRESLRRYFMAEAAQNMIQFDEDVVRQAEEEDFARCSQLNDEWNKETAKSREKRVFVELEARKVVVQQNIIDKLERDKLLLEEIEEKVRRAKADAVSFITESNIDQAIDEALANVVSYNYAIDSAGNKYEGKYEPDQQEPSKRETLQQ